MRPTNASNLPQRPLLPANSSNMDSKPIYVAKPPTVYTAPLWDFQRGWASPLLSSMGSEGSRTVEESLPVPRRPCIYGSVGDGRPNPSVRAECRWTTYLPPSSPKGTSVILPEDTEYGAVGEGRPKPPAERFASHIRSLIPDAETPAPSSLRPGELIYLTTPRGPRYYYERRLVTENLLNYLPSIKSRRKRSVTDPHSRDTTI